MMGCFCPCCRERDATCRIIEQQNEAHRLRDALELGRRRQGSLRDMIRSMRDAARHEYNLSRGLCGINLRGRL